MKLHVFASLGLPALPLRLLHLDVGTVSEHNAAQISSSLRVQDLPMKASCHQPWDHT